MDFQRALTIIMNKPGNRTCADCSTKNPRWVSISLGVFVCIRCCGVHRNLGTHISKMKSVTLDKWQTDWVRLFDALDNEISNRYWERNLPSSYRKPNESSTTYEVESFIRDKYEFKRWIADGEPDPVSAVLTGKNRQKTTEKKPEAVAVTVPVYEPKVREVPSPVVPMMDLLAVEPMQPPKPEYVLDWSAPKMTDFPTAKPPASVPSGPAMTMPPMSTQPVVAPKAVAPQPVLMQPVTQQPVAPQPAVHATDSQTREDHIKSIMSMYGAQSGPPPAQQSTFRPLGAIAAEQMFKNSAGRGTHPGYAPQWPSF